MFILIRDNISKIIYVSMLTFGIMLLEIVYLDLINFIFNEEHTIQFMNAIYSASGKTTIIMIMVLILIRYFGLFYLQSTIVRFGDLESKKIKNLGLKRFLSRENHLVDDGEFIFELSELIHLFIIQIFIPTLRILSDTIMLVILLSYLILLKPVVGVTLIVCLVFMVFFTIP